MTASSSSAAPSVVALAGGVGGAKLAEGLATHLGDRLSVVVNTGDDCERHGLLVMADHDTVLYNLAGIEQVEWGWGIEGDTHATMAQLAAYGEEFDPDWNFFVGPPAEIAERLQPILALGFRHVLVDMPAPYDIETVGRIGELVELLNA